MAGNLRTSFKFFTSSTCLLLLAATLFLSSAAFAQNVEDGFSADADGAIGTLAVLEDGKIIVAGHFTNIAGQTRERIARLHPDGSIDTGFAAVTLDGLVNIASVQADGRIVIFGNFSQVGAHVRNRIARLNADGSVDASYNPSVGSSASVTISAMASQSDGKVVIGGTFDSFGGVPRDNIARLNNDGSLDTSFAPNVDQQVLSLTSTKLMVCSQSMSHVWRRMAVWTRRTAHGSLTLWIPLLSSRTASCW